MEDEQINTKIEGMKKEFVGQEIRGKQLSVIGLGAIGSLVANQVINMGMNVKAFDPGLTVDVALGFGLVVLTDVILSRKHYQTVTTYRFTYHLMMQQRY